VCADEIDILDCELGVSVLGQLLIGESSLGNIGDPQNVSVQNCSLTGPIKLTNGQVSTIFESNKVVASLGGAFKAALFLDGANFCSVQLNTIKMNLPTDMANTGGIVISGRNDFVLGLKCENNNLLITDPQIVRTGVCKVVTAVDAAASAGHQASVKNNTCDCNGNITQFPIYGTECKGSYFIDDEEGFYLKWILTGSMRDPAIIMPTSYAFGNAQYNSIGFSGLPRFIFLPATLTNGVCGQFVAVAVTSPSTPAAYYGYHADYSSLLITASLLIN
jgi:hypothetical protein